MRAFTVFTVLFIAVASVWATSGISSGALLERQGATIPSIPTECDNVCAVLSQMESCKIDLGCLCTNALGQGLADCGACGIGHHNNDPNANQYKAQFQVYINSYTTSCTDAGYPVGPFDLLDGNSTNPSPSGIGSPTPTGSPNDASFVRPGGVLIGVALAFFALTS